MEKFYGSWAIVLNSNTDLQQRFTILGSENADGRYIFPFRKFPNLEIRGIAWSIDYQVVSSTPERLGAWEQRAAKRTSRFEAGSGMLVQLDWGDMPDLSLTCISKDPILNPNPTPNPYDFTLPQNG